MTDLSLLTLRSGGDSCHYEGYLPVSSTLPTPCEPSNSPHLPPTNIRVLRRGSHSPPQLQGLELFSGMSHALSQTFTGQELCHPNSRLWTTTSSVLSFGVPGLSLHQLSPDT